MVSSPHSPRWWPIHFKEFAHSVHGTHGTYRVLTFHHSSVWIFRAILDGGTYNLQDVLGRSQCSTFSGQQEKIINRAKFYKLNHEALESG